MHRKLAFYAAMFLLGMWIPALTSCTIVKAGSAGTQPSKLEVESECLTHLINFAIGMKSEADSILSPKCDETVKTRVNAQRLRARASYYLKYGKMPSDP